MDIVDQHFFMIFLCISTQTYCSICSSIYNVSSINPADDLGYLRNVTCHYMGAYSMQYEIMLNRNFGHYRKAVDIIVTHNST